MTDSILLVDDDPLLLDSVRFSLERAGYKVATAADGAEAIAAARKHSPDLAILDIGLPDADGLQLCRRLQASRPVPVIFLTAHDREMDVILGLERGADDYITKPFSMGELVARVGAVLRRARVGAARPPERYEVGDVVMDLVRHEVRVAGRLVEPPPKQFELLKLLMSRPGEAIGRQQIVDAIWGEDYFGDTRVLDVHIRWLRELIEPDPANPRHLLTVRGVGYKFSDE
ncbi:MAG: response regulator transcription factor [Chloroflexi bacterium]|nr:response regulator transcription factor [Chloroflexota bacterium]